MTTDNLFNEERIFLNEHNIPIRMVFDATGMRKKDWQPKMKKLGLRFAFGTTPCKRGNHTLRTHAGHCIQCDTAKIAYANRHYDEGFVYVAYSSEKMLIKVGLAKSPKERVAKLNSQGYARASDWKVLRSVEVDEAGKVEFAIHSDLANHNVAEVYLRDGNRVVCREVFSCSMDTALHTFKKHTGTRCDGHHHRTATT